MNKKGVFGLTSVQAFFAIILGLALLAYTIIVIFGVLQESNVLPPATLSATVTNETGTLLFTPYVLSKYTTVAGFSSPVIVSITNTTDGRAIVAGNYTFNAATASLTNKTASSWASVKITYTYNYNDIGRNNANDILANTSTGVSNFFGAVNPVYAILAILVIILVLIVLVRVVTGGTGGSGRVENNPQL